VEGVDEADIIKTDGQYIYHLSGGALRIVKADSGKMELTATLDFDKNKDGFYPNDMYVDGNSLTVISSVYIPRNVQNAAPDGGGAEKPMPPDGSYYAYFDGSFVRVLVYDTADKSKPVLTREFTAEGNLLSSRKIDNMLYLVVNKYMYFYGLDTPVKAVPVYSDRQNGALKPVDLGGMRYFPGGEDRGILMICGIDTADGAAAPKINSIIGSGGQIYMSASSLYIAKYDYGYSMTMPVMPAVRGSGAAAPDYSDRTSFFKFALDNGDVIYTATGAADGNVLNQYSMDEYDGYFRVATTVGGSAKNALTVFGPNMTVAGKIDDMAPGEKIYSARFMGGRAYMVTYRTVDPLFAIDLSRPSNPKVLGELKIPGYNSYLHPYDETRLIGFGRDTEEMKTVDSKGNVVNTFAVNKGLKLSLYDISDIMNPKEIDAVSIGDANAISDLLYNPKALLFSKEKGFLAFPVTQYPSTGYYGGEAYEPFAGAYVYDVSPDGFKLRGRIVHESAADYFDNYDYANGDPIIQRIIYIGDMFYSATGTEMQSNRMDDLAKAGVVKYGNSD